MDEQTAKAAEIWQAEIEGAVRSLGLDEIAALIPTGMLLPTDKVRRGNLRWLEAGRVPALAAYFAKADAGPVIPEAAANKDLKFPLTQPNFSTDPAPQPATVSNSSLVKSFIYVLLLSLVFTYLWMYYRDAKDRAERAAATPEARADERSMTEVEASYEKRKKFLTAQSDRTEKVLAGIEAEATKLSPTVDVSVCYQLRNVPREGPYYFDNAPAAVEKELDPQCVEHQKANARKQAILDERDRKRLKEDLLKKRTEIAAELDELESDTQSEREQLTQGFYMAAAKGRFYYGFIPILLVLVVLNCVRIFIRKNIAQPLQPSKLTV